MSDTHDTGGHHGPNVQAYLLVFGALSIFTAISFVVNHHFGTGSTPGMLIILGVAVVKACLVGFIFMHLKWDWRKLYFMIVPVFILAVMMMIVFMPDIVIAWKMGDLEPSIPGKTVKSQK
jgi:caa(3)-type oxidase subunit IV